MATAHLGPRLGGTNSPDATGNNTTAWSVEVKVVSVWDCVDLHLIYLLLPAPQSVELDISKMTMLFLTGYIYTKNGRERTFIWGVMKLEGKLHNYNLLQSYLDGISCPLCHTVKQSKFMRRFLENKFFQSLKSWFISWGQDRQVCSMPQSELMYNAFDPLKTGFDIFLVHFCFFLGNLEGTLVHHRRQGHAAVDAEETRWSNNARCCGVCLPLDGSLVEVF